MRGLFTILSVILFSISNLVVFGQGNPTEKIEKNIYRKSWNLGVMVHTRGVGGTFRHETFKGAMQKNFWTIELYNIKHAKEEKTYGVSGDDSRSFVYGKLNHLYVLKGGIGKQKTLFEKEIIRGVQISTVYNLNVALGFLKPVYLEVFKQQQDNFYISTERYDPAIHGLGDISGKASWFRGFGDMQVVPGLSGKFALNFEFAPQDNKIKALETGINVDAFIQSMPIMAYQNDQLIFVNLYLNFQFGRKSYL